MRDKKPVSTRPAELLLAALMPLAPGSAAAQIQHAPPRPQPTTAGDNGLGCKEIRLTQLDGDPENYHYVIKQARHAGQPDASSFTLKRGESRIVETGEAPFALYPDNLLDFGYSPVTPSNAPSPPGGQLSHVLVESGAGIVMHTSLGTRRPGHDLIVTGPHAASREVSLHVTGDCSAATQVRFPLESEPPPVTTIPRPAPLLTEDAPAVARLLKLLPTLGKATPYIAAIAGAYEALHPTEVDRGETEGLQRLEDARNLKCPPGMPTITFSYAKFPTIAPGIALSQAQHPEWKILTISRNDVSLVNRRRDAACSPIIKNNFKPLSCDEYPFASTVEGGKNADVWPAFSAEQNRQGQLISQFYNVPKVMADGTKFCVAITP